MNLPVPGARTPRLEELPAGWDLLEEVNDSVDVDGIRLYRAGFAARGPGGRVATGSAAGLDGPPRTRAVAELLERTALLQSMVSSNSTFPTRDPGGAAGPGLPRGWVFPESDAPDAWSYARSSGVALAGTWAEACRRAVLEVVERQRVLRSWVGESRPVRIDAPGPWPETRGYHWRAYSFPGDELWAGPAVVVGVFGFPRRTGLPFLRGWAADVEIVGAWRRAMGECLQGLAFLYGEPVPSAAPAPDATPTYHLDLFLWPGAHSRLQGWLEGTDGVRPTRSARRPDDQVHYVDLAPSPGCGQWSVAKAVVPGAVPLAFGDVPGLSRAGLAHPIP